MTGEVEALGALTTAGLAASVVDRPVAHGHGHDAACANCDTPLVGEYCHACGQQGHVHRSIGHIFEEFLHGVYHFDSKAWRTLPLLVFRPGRLTWDYVHGKRARFIAPLALFLLTVFMMFFVFGFVGGPNLDALANAADRNQQVSEAKAAVDGLRADISGTQTDLAQDDVTASEKQKLTTQLGAEQLALRAAEARLATVTKSGANVRWQDTLSKAVKSGELKVDLGNGTIDERVRDALLNPDFALYRIQQKAYKLSFLLVPLSLPTLWLMFFWRRHVRTFDHVVFALYSLSFMSLLFIVTALMDKFGGSLMRGVAELRFFVPPVHMFAQLRGGYRLSTFGALWRACVLSVSAIVTLSLFAMLIIIVGLAD